MANRYSDPANALKEFLDNALHYCVMNYSNEGTGFAKIEVHIFPNQATKKHFIVVVDNGKGMTMEELKSFNISGDNLKMKDNEYDDHFFTNPSRYENKSHNPLLVHQFADHNLSFYGQGAKRAGYYLGKCLHVVTKVKDRSIDKFQMCLNPASGYWADRVYVCALWEGGGADAGLSLGRQLRAK